MEENFSLLFLLILTENGTEHGLSSPFESLYFKETIDSCSSYGADADGISIGVDPSAYSSYLSSFSLHFMHSFVS